MKANKFFKYTSFLFLSAAVLTVCGDFEKINTNKQGVSTQMAKGDGVSAGKSSKRVFQRQSRREARENHDSKMDCFISQRTRSME